jgi:hypothetical protein
MKVTPLHVHAKSIFFLSIGRRVGWKGRDKDTETASYALISSFPGSLTFGIPMKVCPVWGRHFQVRRGIKETENRSFVILNYFRESRPFGTNRKDYEDILAKLSDSTVDVTVQSRFVNYCVESLGNTPRNTNYG